MASPSKLLIGAALASTLWGLDARAQEPESSGVSAPAPISDEDKKLLELANAEVVEI
nr:hypothetical protein [Deltaproteobacteria bacterium]